MKFVDHFFLGDKMVSFVDQLHEVIAVTCPIIQNVIWIFALAEVNNSVQSVNFGCDCLIHHKIG